jgi:AraC family transcriptional regulator, arabinose operon regulatory protein
MRRETPYPDIVALLTGHERRGGNWCWRPRGTPTPLLIHTRSGHGALRIASGHEQHTISAGDTVMWTAGAHQEFGSDGKADPWEIVWAHFRPRAHWHEWLRWPTLGAGVARIPAPQPGLRARIDAALMEMNASADGVSPRATDFALNALERALLWLDAASPGPQQLDERIHEAISFIARNLAGRLTVRAIADAVALSPSRLSHLFTEQVGTSPARFVELRRIERAQALLASSSLPVGAIAEATGFSSQFYFATRFRALAGMSPSQWRAAGSVGDPRRSAVH